MATRMIAALTRPQRGKRPQQDRPRLPAATEIAIDDQRASIGTAISLLYCLHVALRNETEGASPDEGEPVAHAAEWADLTEITAMILVRLHLVHRALDSASLRGVYVSPGRISLTEAARKATKDSRP